MDGRGGEISRQERDRSAHRGRGDRYLLVDGKRAILGGEILGVHVSMLPSLHSG